jgi:hypothetical protein
VTSGEREEAGSSPVMTRVGERVRAVCNRERVVLLVVFVATRVAYSIAGVRFDASGLDYSSQLIDRVVLRDRLVESVWYLHAQPPAFNLFVGTVLRWSPFGPDLSFHLAFLACGLVLTLALHDLGRRLGLGPRTAVVVAALIACSPTTVLFENWLSYEYPVATMVVVLVDLVVRYAARPRVATLVAATSVAALATLTRSLLHPAWLVVVFVLLVLYRRPASWKHVAYAALPLVIVAAFMVKSEVLFGTPQLSSWFGYNVHKTVVQQLTADQRRQLQDEGFRAAEAAPCERRHPDVPAVSEELKQTPTPAGEPRVENFNNECLIATYQALEVDARAVATAHPRWVARNVAGGAEIWASPASLNPFVYANRDKVAAVDDVDRRLVLLDVAWDPPIAVPNAWPLAASAPDHRFHVSLTILLTTTVVSVAGLVALVRWRRRTPFHLALLIGGGTVLFASVAGNLFEYGENNRIRFVVEPLTLLLAAALAASLIRLLSARRSRRSGPRADPARQPEPAGDAIV